MYFDILPRRDDRAFSGQAIAKHRLDPALSTPSGPASQPRLGSLVAKHQVGHQTSHCAVKTSCDAYVGAVAAVVAAAAD